MSDSSNSGFSLVPVDHDPFADDYQVQSPPQDLAKLYANNGGLGTIQDYFRRSGEALARIPSELGHNVYGLLEAAGTNVALPSLQRSQELYDTDWSKQPFIGIGSHGEFTGRLPALAEATVPYLAGGAPGGALGAGMKLPGGYEGGYHGTPHTFAAEEGHPLGRFKDEAIGTGEGAQAEAYGHYIAGKQFTAENYRGSIDLKFNGKSYLDDPNSFIADHGKLAWNATETYIDSGYNLNTALDELAGKFTGKRRQAAQDWLKENHTSIEVPGNLYAVEIKPPESELLDWRKPISEHPKSVQDKLEGLPVQAEKDMTGEGFYRKLSDKLGGDPLASKALDESGVPGVRFLDSMSQKKVNRFGFETVNPVTGEWEDAGKYIRHPTREHAEKILAHPGNDKYRNQMQVKEFPIEDNPDLTYNYVIFHPDNLRVVGKNGEPIENYLKDTPVIKAYHGGPSNEAFTKFSSDKFGSESGQSIDGLYVPGIYATSNPGVARWYRDIATDPYEVSWKGKVIQNPETDLPKEIRAHGLLPQEGIEGYIEKLQKNISSPHSAPEWVRENQKELEFVQNNLANLATRKKSKDEMGSLFGVNLATEHNNLLDWEKPLSKQPNAVQQYIKKIDPDQKVFSNDMKGEYIYENLLHHHGVPKEATKLGDEAYTKYPNYAAPVTKILDENGIHGIKHLDKELSDQVGGPNGTTYVIFNPDKVSIHSKNNKPIENYLKDIK